LDQLLDHSDKAGGTLWSLAWNKDPRHLPVKVETRTRNTRLSLIPGDVRIFRYEEQLALAWAQYRDRPTESLELMTRLGRGLDAIERRSKADFLFFDTAPTLGALNRNVVLESDFLIVPVGIDLFSARGLKTLGRGIVEWLEEWSHITRFAPADLLSRQGEPVLGGYVLQRVPARSTKQSRAAIARIQTRVRTDLQSVIARHNRRLARGRESDLRLGGIPDFPSMSGTQEGCEPLWEKDPKTRRHFEGLADKLIGRVRKMR
jgi:cellulose biosynthesis protein BcsQ